MQNCLLYKGTGEGKFPDVPRELTFFRQAPYAGHRPSPSEISMAIRIWISTSVNRGQRT